MKRQILILGAGLVAGPMIKYFLKNKISITVADLDTTKAVKIIGENAYGRAVTLDVNNQEKLSELITDHQLIVSLLPYTLHINVARLCLRLRKMLVTTSYISQEMAALDSDVKEADLIFLNECGLDPGIDHMSVMQLRDQLIEKGNRINEVYSYCGALPAPESANNPFKYKFSWSPKGVLLAGNNDARFKKDNVIKEIKTESLFSHPETIEFDQIGTLEVYPNRDSITYLDTYNLQTCHTLIRGTFRYPGWCDIMDTFKQLNLTQTTPLKPGKTRLSAILAFCTGVDESTDLKHHIQTKIGGNKSNLVIEALEYLGLFSDRIKAIKSESPLDILAELMINKMMLSSHERDLVVMQHTFKVTSPELKEKTIVSRLIAYGDPDNDTAIARTVALPAAIAAKLILEKKITLTGVIRPINPELYNPILSELEREGIYLKESY